MGLMRRDGSVGLFEIEVKIWRLYMYVCVVR
jgi:hypothetical protein